MTFHEGPGDFSHIKGSMMDEEPVVYILTENETSNQRDDHPPPPKIRYQKVSKKDMGWVGGRNMSKGSYCLCHSEDRHLLRWFTPGSGQKELGRYHPRLPKVLPPSSFMERAATGWKV